MSDTHPHEPAQHNGAIGDGAPHAAEDTSTTHITPEIAAPDEQWAPRESDQGDTSADVPVVDELESTVPMSRAEGVEAAAPHFIAPVSVAESEFPTLIEPAPLAAPTDSALLHQPVDEASPIIADPSVGTSQSVDTDAPRTVDNDSIEGPVAPDVAPEPDHVDRRAESNFDVDRNITDEAPTVVAERPAFPDQAVVGDLLPVPAGIVPLASPSSEMALSHGEPSDAVRNQYVITSPENSAELSRSSVLEPAHVDATKSVLATADPGIAESEFARPAQRVVYVDAPAKPKKKSNRGVGSLFAALSGVLYAILFAAVVFVLFYATTGRVVTNFVGQTSFFVPILLFMVGFVVLVLIANRAGWWVYALGSIFVGIFVYFATIAILLLLDGVLQVTPDQATAAFGRALSNPLVIAAALLARELSLWVGLAVSARGRRVKMKNQKALDEFNREAAERKAKYGRAAEANATAIV